MKATFFIVAAAGAAVAQDPYSSPVGNVVTQIADGQIQAPTGYVPPPAYTTPVVESSAAAPVPTPHSSISSPVAPFALPPSTSSAPASPVVLSSKSSPVQSTPVPYSPASIPVSPEAAPPVHSAAPASMPQVCSSFVSPIYSSLASPIYSSLANPVNSSVPVAPYPTSGSNSTTLSIGVLATGVIPSTSVAGAIPASSPSATSQAPALNTGAASTLQVSFGLVAAGLFALCI